MTRTRRFAALRFASLLAVVGGVSGGAGVTTSAGEGGKRAAPSEAGPTKPPLPAIESIQLEPPSLTLADGRDGRQVLVWGVAADGKRFDLSDVATFKPDSDEVAVADGRYLYPAKAGEATVTVSAE